MNSSKQDVVFSYISLLYAAHNDFIGIIPSSILAFLHFILVSIAEIIFHFHGSHEQFHIGHCVWNVSLVHQAGKYFIGLLPSSMSALLHFILVFITEIIFHFHGGHEQFHKGYCVWNISLLPPACKSFRGIIPSSIPTFLHFILVYIIEIIFYFHGIHEQFHIWYCVWNVSLLPSTCTEFIGIIPSSTPAFFHFILVSIVVRIYFHGIQEQFHIGYCVWNASLLNPAREDFVGIIPFSIPIFLHFILVSIAETVYFHGIHGQYHIGCFVWNVYLLQSTRKVFIGIILFPILFFLILYWFPFFILWQS